MSANHQAAAFLRWRSRPLAQRRGLNTNLAFYRVTAALHTGRQLLETLDRAWRGRFAANGGPHIPPDRPPSDDIWDDPALWMLMMH